MGTPMKRVDDFDSILQALKDQGWTVEQRTSGHFQGRPPSPGMKVVHFSRVDSADFRSCRNTISQLRRSGFVWPPPERPIRRTAIAGDESIAPAPSSANDFAEVLPVEGVVTMLPKAKFASPLEEDDGPLTEEDLWAKLKECREAVVAARELLAEADEAVKRKEDAWKAAQDQRDHVRAELEVARAALKAAKADFAHHFDASMGGDA